MKNIIGLVTIFCVLIGCKAQTGKSAVYDKEFKWSITIPEDFERVPPEKWHKEQNKGADMIEKTYGEKVPDRPKTIFVFKSNDFNYFESSYQAFDTSTDGDYIKSCMNVNNVLYGTFMTQLPGIKIDTTISTDFIDSLAFQTFKMKVTYPNNMVMHVLMYSRLFGKKEFTCNIIYVDADKGDLMLDAWMKSTFGKQ